MATRLYVDFSDAQGHIIWQSVLRSCRKSNSFKRLCMSSIHARIKMIELKMKALEWPQDFSRYKSVVNFRDAQGQLTPQSVIGSG